MSDQRFHTVLGRLDSGPRPGDDEIGQRLWERIEPALDQAGQPERVEQPAPVTVDVEDDSDGLRWRWWWPRLLAAGVAAAAIVVLALLATGGDDTTEIVPADSTAVTSVPDPAAETTTAPATTVPGSTVPSTTAPDTSVAPTVAPTSAATAESLDPLEAQPDADTVLDVAFGPDDAPWAIIVPPGDDGWAIVHWDGDTWRTMASQDDGSSPEFVVDGQNFPRIVGVRPDGGVWFHGALDGLLPGPSVPTELWEFDGSVWIDHTDVGRGSTDSGFVDDVDTFCCYVAMAPDGTVWTGSHVDVRTYDDDGWTTVPDMTFDDLGLRAGELGLPAAPDVLGLLDVDGDDADRACLEQVGGDGFDFDDPFELGRALSLATLDIEVGPDGAVWHSVVCVGVVRYEPADGTTTVFPLDETFPNRLVTSLTPAPDGTLWVTGSGGIVRLDPTPDQ